MKYRKSDERILDSVDILQGTEPFLLQYVQYELKSNAIAAFA